MSKFYRDLPLEVTDPFLSIKSPKPCPKHNLPSFVKKAKLLEQRRRISEAKKSV